MAEHKKFILTFIRHSVIHWHQVFLFVGTIFPAVHCEPLRHLTCQCEKRVPPPSAGHTCPHNSRWTAWYVFQLQGDSKLHTCTRHEWRHGASGDYPEQLYQLHFIHPYITCIRWYGNSTIAVRCDYFPFHIPDIFTFPNDLLSLSPSIVRSLSNFCTVICRLGKQRLSTLQR